MAGVKKVQIKLPEMKTIMFEIKKNALDGIQGRL